MADLTECFVVLIVCSGVSMFLLCPVSALGGPADVGINLY